VNNSTITCESGLETIARTKWSNGSVRSLYDCFHARAKGKSIYCDKGHRLCESLGGNGAISVERLARGNPLVFGVCQECADFVSMGEPLLPEERGWMRTGPSLGTNRGMAWQSWVR